MRAEVWLDGLKHREGETDSVLSPYALWHSMAGCKEFVQYKSLPKNPSFPKDCSAVEATKLQLLKED